MCPVNSTLTAFGIQQEPAPVRLPEASADVPSEEEPQSATRADPNNFNVCNRSPSAVLEGWAPPLVPLHGPLFRNLSAHEKQDLVKLHKNLGHPDPMKLSRHLEALGALSLMLVNFFVMHVWNQPTLNIKDPPRSMMLGSSMN